MSQPGRTPGRLVWWLRASWLAATTVLFCLPACAHAENDLPAQALADNGLGLLYEPPPAQRAGLCLVDTGVNLNPDTQPDVLERTAIDNGTPDDVSPTSHGTILAMLAIAPLNGWGAVGVAPNAIQIISVRILRPGQSTFPFSSYATGITRCLELSARDDIKVINLSLGTPETPGSQAYEEVGDAIERARSYGIAVVAAAGNDDARQVEYPAAYPGVLSVGALDTQGGAFCSFSNRGAGLQLLAPGCDLDAADPASGTADYNYWQGTSEASIIAAAALDALCSYDPQLAPQTVAEDLKQADGGTLNIAAAFQTAGLGEVIREGEALAPHPPQPATLVNASPGGLQPSSPTQADALPATTVSPRAPFPKPRARLRYHDGRLLLALENHPPGAQTRIWVHRLHTRPLEHHQDTRRLPEHPPDTPWHAPDHGALHRPARRGTRE